MRTITLQLNRGSALRRAQWTALAAVASALLFVPSSARADDGDDKSDKKPAATSTKGGSSDEGASAEEGAFTLDIKDVSVTGGPGVGGLQSGNGRMWRNAGVVGAAASGMLLFTQARSGAMANPASALLTPFGNSPTLGNPDKVLVNPEPGTVALLAAGLGVLGFVGYRRKRA